MSLFQAVKFEPEPEQIRLQFLKEAKEGDIEIHFRDPEHLRSIVEQTPMAVAKKGKVYFIHDITAEDRREFYSPAECLDTKLFVNITSDVPLKLTGNLILPLSLNLPRQSGINQLNLKANAASISFSALETYENAVALASVVEEFDEQLYKIRTADAYELLRQRRAARERSPKLFPDLLEICPRLLLISGPSLQIHQEDYIEAHVPLIYIAGSKQNLKQLHDTLPEFESSIPYIDPACSDSGVYCLGPLYLRRGFTILSQEDISITGQLVLPDHNLKIKSKDSVWCIGGTIMIGGSISISAVNLSNLAFNPYESPEGIPADHWQAIVEYWTGQIPPITPA